MTKDYSRSKIYCIRNRADDDKIVYIGQTTVTLARRMAKHRMESKDPKNSNTKLYKLMNQFGTGNFYIELIKCCPCQSKDELSAYASRAMRENYFGTV